MAEATVKARDPLRCALFDTFTLGIYGFYWHYATNSDLAERGHGDNPTLSFLAALPGVLVLVPFFVSTYNTAQRINAARREAGLAEDVNAGLATVAAILYPIAVYYLQKKLNEAYAAG